MHREVDPARILRDIPAFGVTNALFVPAVIHFLLLTPGVETTDFSSLRSIVYGASPITDTVLVQRDARLRVRVRPGLRAHRDDRRDHAARPRRPRPVARPHLLRSCGKPYPWVEVRIVDPDTGAEVAGGEVGELWTRSCQNMVGYWANDDATASVLDADGWFRTGDAGYIDDDGYLYLHDRLKDMIVSGGENVYPAEVENVLAESSRRRRRGGHRRSRRALGRVGHGRRRPRDGSDVDGDALIAFARDHLGGYKLPKSVVFADVLPRNPSGKLLKREIRAPYWEGATARSGRYPRLHPAHSTPSGGHRSICHSTSEHPTTARTECVTICHVEERRSAHPACALRGVPTTVVLYGVGGGGMRTPTGQSACASPISRRPSRSTDLKANGPEWVFQNADTGSNCANGQQPDTRYRTQVSVRVADRHCAAWRGKSWQ